MLPEFSKGKDDQFNIHHLKMNITQFQNWQLSFVKKKLQLINHKKLHILKESVKLHSQVQVERKETISYDLLF